MSMLSVSSCMCSQATHYTSSSPGSTLFFSYMRTVWYVNFRTTKKVIISKQLLSLDKNRNHNGSSIQCAYNKPSPELKKINLLQLVKATLTPSHHLRIEGDLTKIFSEICKEFFYGI